MRLNPLCDIVKIKHNSSIRLYLRMLTKTIILEGKSVNKIFKFFYLLNKGCSFVKSLNLFKDYKKPNIKVLMDKLYDEKVLGKSFSKNIISISSDKIEFLFSDFKKRVINRQKKLKIGIVETGNISLLLAQLLHPTFLITKFKIKGFSYPSTKKSLGKISFLNFIKQIKEKGVKYIIFLPEKLGIKSQIIFEKKLKNCDIGLITGFRKDGVYYIKPININFEAFFYRICYNFSPEDLFFGWQLSQINKNNIISREKYFGVTDATWISLDLAKEIFNTFARNDMRLFNKVIIYDLLLHKKHISNFVEIPNRGENSIPDIKSFSAILKMERKKFKKDKEIAILNTLSKKFIGEGTILPEVEIVAPKNFLFPPFYFYYSRYSSFLNPTFYVDKSFQLIAGGASFDKKLARLKAIMEGLERYANGFYDLEKLHFARAVDLDKGYIDPRNLVAYHSSQYRKFKTIGYPLRKFSPHEKFFWTKSFNLMKNKEVYVLADCVFYPFSLPQEKNIKLYTFANSSGSAAHFSLEEAVKKGIMELCERDAFMIVWLNKLSRPLIRKNTLPSFLRNRINTINSLEFEVYLIDITMDLFPVILAIATRRGDFPSFVCGAASSINPIEAVDKALIEVESDLFIKSKEDFLRGVDKDKILSPQDHATFYYHPKNFKKVKFLFESPKSISINQVKTFKVRLNGNLKEVISYLKNKGKEVIIVNLISSDIFKLQPDLKIVKVFIPGLVPIYFGYHLEPLGIRRIYSLPIHLGYRDEELNHEDINISPHPFP